MLCDAHTRIPELFDAQISMFDTRLFVWRCSMFGEVGALPRIRESALLNACLSHANIAVWWSLKGFWSVLLSDLWQLSMLLCPTRKFKLRWA